MGRIAKILSYFKTQRNGASVSDIKADPGGGANITYEHFEPAGDDSQPLAGDFIVTVENAGAGRASAVGFLDPKNAKLSGPGEKRLYARNSSGAVVVSVWLKADSSVVINNGGGNITLEPSGTVNINGATIDPSGRITSPTQIVTPSLLSGGKEITNHTHPAGSPPGNTGPNN